MLKLQRGLDARCASQLCARGERFAPEPLTDERAASGSRRPTLDGAPASVLAISRTGSSPRCAASSATISFAETAGARHPRAARPAGQHPEGRAARRRMTRLPHLNAVETPLSPLACALRPSEDGRGPAVQSEPEFIKGWIEIQDEGSQLAALLAGVEARRAGGRSLRRRRRQDPGARRHDGQPRPDLRHRQRRPPSCADP